MCIRDSLVIFRHATGHPQPYTIPTIYAYYMCGYDDRGNLVVDGYGYGSHGAAGFAILPHGAQHLQKLTLDPEPAAPGGIQWDGKCWAIGDAYSTIYRFDVTRSKGTKVGTTTLAESSTVFEFFISGDRIVAPEHETGKVQIFPYPVSYTHLVCAIAAAHYLGGQYLSWSHAGDPDAQLPIVPVSLQTERRAMAVLDASLFSPDALRVPASVLNRLRYSEWSGYGYTGWEGYGNLPTWAYNPPARHDFPPVSYTHLDVYKRQP